MKCSYASCSDIVTKPQKCPSCNQATYCCTNCRVQDWYKTHQKVCSNSSKVVKSPNSSETPSTVIQNSSISSKPISGRASPIGVGQSSILQNSQSSPAKKISPIPAAIKSSPLEYYEDLNRTLGTGSYGEVKLVKHKPSSLLFAMKIINKRSVEQEASLDIILREISIHKELSHPNIIKLHESFSDAESIYLILEYAESGSLFQKINSEGKLTEESACKIYFQVVTGIKHLHDNQIVHRDIKPENILICKNGEIKVCDFGWCVKGEEMRSTFCGTLDYMPPEMIKGQKHSYEVDVWALGVLLYEMLHGVSPFEAAREADKCQNIVNCKFKFAENISDFAKDLITKMIQPVPANRIKLEEVLQHSFFEVRVPPQSCISVGCTFRYYVKNYGMDDGTVEEILGKECKVIFKKSGVKEVMLCEEVERRLKRNKLGRKEENNEEIKEGAGKKIDASAEIREAAVDVKKLRVAFEKKQERENSVDYGKSENSLIKKVNEMRRDKSEEIIPKTNKVSEIAKKYEKEFKKNEPKPKISSEKEVMEIFSSKFAELAKEEQDSGIKIDTYKREEPKNIKVNKSSISIDSSEDSEVDENQLLGNSFKINIKQEIPKIQEPAKFYEQPLKPDQLVQSLNDSGLKIVQVSPKNKDLSDKKQKKNLAANSPSEKAVVFPEVLPKSKEEVSISKSSEPNRENALLIQDDFKNQEDNEDHDIKAESIYDNLQNWMSTPSRKPKTTKKQVPGLVDRSRDKSIEKSMEKFKDKFLEKEEPSSSSLNASVNIPPRSKSSNAEHIQSPDKPKEFSLDPVKKPGVNKNAGAAEKNYSSAFGSIHLREDKQVKFKDSSDEDSSPNSPNIYKQRILENMRKKQDNSPSESPKPSIHNIFKLPNASPKRSVSPHFNEDSDPYDEACNIFDEQEKASVRSNHFKFNSPHTSSIKSKLSSASPAVSQSSIKKQKSRNKSPSPKAFPPSNPHQYNPKLFDPEPKAKAAAKGKRLKDFEAQRELLENERDMFYNRVEEMWNNDHHLVEAVELEENEVEEYESKRKFYEYDKILQNPPSVVSVVEDNEDRLRLAQEKLASRKKELEEMILKVEGSRVVPIRIKRERKKNAGLLKWLGEIIGCAERY